MAFWAAQILMTQQENQYVIPLNQILERAIPLREKLLDGANYRWRSDPKRFELLKDISAGRSRLDKADDLARLAMLFNDPLSPPN